MTSIGIKLIDIVNSKSFDGMLTWKVDENENCNLKLTFDEQEIYGRNDDFFEALREIRSKIYPIIPAIYGAALEYYPSSMSRQMSNAFILCHDNLGRQGTEKDQVNIFDSCNNAKNLSSPEQQRAYHEIWSMSLGVNRYGIPEKYILINKVSKYIYDPEKRLNSNYQFFWIYDKENNKIYNIKHKWDIYKFRLGRIKEEWSSFHEFLEYYIKNWMSRPR